MVKPRVKILVRGGYRLYEIKNVGALSPFKAPLVFWRGKRYITNGNPDQLAFTGSQAPQFKLKPQL